MSGEEAVLVDVEDGVATLTLHRPSVRNALTEEISAGIIDALAELEGSDARCLVVTGAGGAFSAGGDVNAMSERLAGGVTLDESVRHISQETSRAVKRVAEFGLPTIAKIDGVAFGDDGFVEAPLDLEAELGSSKGQLVGLLDRQRFACRPNGDGFDHATVRGRLEVGAHVLQHLRTRHGRGPSTWLRVRPH